MKKITEVLAEPDGVYVGALDYDGICEVVYCFSCDWEVRPANQQNFGNVPMTKLYLHADSSHPDVRAFRSLLGLKPKILVSNLPTLRGQPWKKMGGKGGYWGIHQEQEHKKRKFQKKKKNRRRK